MKYYLLILSLLITYSANTFADSCNIEDKSDCFALIIANGNYTPAKYKLSNATNDAELVKKTLLKSGFEVATYLDAKHDEMVYAISAFTKHLNQNPDATGLFYYSGHGIFLQESNYMLGTDFNTKRKLNVDDLLNKLHSNKRNIVILDACADIPTSIKKGEKDDKGISDLLLAEAPKYKALGLDIRDYYKGIQVQTQKDYPENLFIAWAAIPGRLASSQAGTENLNNSLYTHHLFKYINEQSLTLPQVFSESLSFANKQDERKQQVPQFLDIGGLFNNFYFIPPVTPQTGGFLH